MPNIDIVDPEAIESAEVEFGEFGDPTWVKFGSAIRDVLQPGMYYFVVARPDGSRLFFSSEKAAVEAAEQQGGVVIQELTRQGLQALALATQTKALPTNPIAGMEVCGDHYVLTVRSDLEVVVVVFDREMKPVFALANMAYGNDRTSGAATGMAFASERQFAHPGDVVALAETRARNRAIEASVGGGSTAREVAKKIPPPPEGAKLTDFLAWLRRAGIQPSVAASYLGNLSEIADYRAAAETLLSKLGGE